MDIYGYNYGYMPLNPFKNLILTSDLLRLVGEIDEIKGAWMALGNLAPDRLATLRRVGTAASVGASTRIAGAKITDKEADVILSTFGLAAFRTRAYRRGRGYSYGSWR